MLSDGNRMTVLFVSMFCLSMYYVLSAPVLPDEQALLVELFNKQQYDNSVRPVFNSSKNVEVSFGFTLIQIMDMMLEQISSHKRYCIDEKNQVLIVNAWLDMNWKDERIHWNKSEYNGLEVVRLPAKHLWLPDIVLYNNADDYTAGFMPINAMVHSDGIIVWSPPVRLKLSCKVDITYFPFDHQVCRLKFGSWTYDKAQVDLLNKTGEVDVSAYVTNGEWMLTSYVIVRNEVVYPISPAIYPDVTVILTIQRRILYYVLNILFPCFWLNILSVLTFCLPPDAGEKITLSITVLLSYSVFMLLVAESMPPTSEFVPLIGIYLTMSMAVASISVILTVAVLKLHHCSPHQKPIPRWVRLYILGILSRVVRCNCERPCKHQQHRTKRDVKFRSEREGDVDSKDIHSRLLREIGDLQNRSNGNSRMLNENNSHLISSSGNGNSELADFVESKYNLEYRDVNKMLRNPGGDESFSTNNRSVRGVDIMADILKYLKIMVQKSDAMDNEAEIVDEWKQVALVVDRLFFWLFLLVTIFSSLVILVIVPSFNIIAEDGI